MTNPTAAKTHRPCKLKVNIPKAYLLPVTNATSPIRSGTSFSEFQCVSMRPTKSNLVLCTYQPHVGRVYVHNT
jgi:hypothetical protein